MTARSCSGASRPLAAALFAAALLLAALCPSRAFAQSETFRPEVWVTNGPVFAVAESGGVLYLGGSFSFVGPEVASFVGLDAVTGEVDAVFPDLDRGLNVALPDGAGGWYVGGGFYYVGGVSQRALAHILPGGTLDPVFNPVFDNTVEDVVLHEGTLYAAGAFFNVNGVNRRGLVALDAVNGDLAAWDAQVNTSASKLLLDGSTLYVGGGFTSIGGVARKYLAAVDLTTHTVLSWDPRASASVSQLALSGTTLYAAGSFDSLGGAARNELGAVSTVTGDSTAFKPNPTGGAAGTNVLALEVSGGSVYIGGQFTFAGGQSRSRLAEVSASTGLATGWNPSLDAYADAITVAGSSVYIGGLFRAVGGTPRHGLAELDAASGTPTAWNPGAGGNVRQITLSGGTAYLAGSFDNASGATRNRIAAIDLKTGAATAWDPNAGTAFSHSVSCLAVDGSTVYAGGSFTAIGGQSRSNVAALDATTGLATAWNPGADSLVLEIAPVGSTVYLAGRFANSGGQPRSKLAEIDAVTGLATAWNPNATGGYAQALLVKSDTLYAGGSFTAAGGLAGSRLVALDRAAGTAFPWNPAVNGVVYDLLLDQGKLYAGGGFSLAGGQSRDRLAAFDLATGGVEPWSPQFGQECASDIVYSLAASDSAIFAGGLFSSAGGAVRLGVAGLDRASGLATPWNPGDVQVPGGCSNVSRVLVAQGNLVLAGDLTTIENLPHRGLALFPLEAGPPPPPPPPPLPPVIGISLHQNPVYSRFAEVIVASDSVTAGLPSLVLWAEGGGDTTGLPLAAVGESDHAYRAAVEFEASGAWQLRADLAFAGAPDTAVTRAVNVLLARPGEGGELAVPGGFARLRVPAGAVGETVCFLAQAGVGPGSDAAEAACAFGPERAFGAALAVEFDLGSRPARSAGRPVVLRRSGGAWQELPSEVLPGGMAVRAFVTRLGEFALGRAEEEGAAAYARGPRLHEPRPNPFNPQVQLRYELPAAGFARLEIFDARGRMVRTLACAAREAGEHVVSWDGADELGREQASGLYFARLRSAGAEAVRKLLLLR